MYVDTASYYDEFPEDAPDVCEISDMGPDLAKCQCDECLGRRPHPPTGFPWTQYDILDPNVDTDLEIHGTPHDSQHRYLLCGRYLKGFNLKTKKWGKLTSVMRLHELVLVDNDGSWIVSLDVAYCQPPKMNLRAIDTLVMPTEKKEMIKALMHKFTSADSTNAVPGSWRADFIESKGEGRVFLLHGSPGVGKTYVSFYINACDQGYGRTSEY